MQQNSSSCEAVSYADRVAGLAIEDLYAVAQHASDHHLANAALMRWLAVRRHSTDNSTVSGASRPTGG